ncbi:MAG: aspartate-semialdehyde dehydrogenase, partial [Bermanella sp.]
MSENTKSMNVGLVGWRGMVGSVLMQRMQQEGDFELINPTFFTTSQKGQPAPNYGKTASLLQDALDIDALQQQDAIISCQGGDYTKAVYQKLRAAGWQGYWIDAASSLRMDDSAIIVLDPVNMNVIKDGIKSGVKTYV